MFRRLFALIGIGVAGAAHASDSFAPYAQAGTNQIYNLLFCDEPDAFKPKPGEIAAPWQAVLFNQPVSPQAVAALASDISVEGRIRALAYNWLRTNGQTVPAKQLLGVIVEVPLAGGLDVLAVFADGGVRYINQTGKLSVFEGVPNLQPVAFRLLKASGPIVASIGPWEKSRLPPPTTGKIRLTFVVSDGLYFGEGLMSVMQREPLAAPVIQHATELLQLVVGSAVK